MAGFTIPDQDAPPPGPAEQAAVETTVVVPGTEETGTPAPATAEQAAAGGGSIRRPSTHVVSNAGGPFSLPRRECGVDLDVDMEDVSGRVDGAEHEAQVRLPLSKRVQTMPTLPTPPIFRGSTAQEKQGFMKKITGEQDFDKVTMLMSRKLVMDVSLTDADSKLAHAMYQVLETENMEWMVESEPKKIVHYLMDALAPEQFKKTVKNELARESNKPLLKDVVAFIKWLRASSGEAEDLLRKWREARPGNPPVEAKVSAPVHAIKALRLEEAPIDPGSACMARAENVLDIHDVLLDSGADVNVASRGLVDQLLRSGAAVREAQCPPRQLATFDGSCFDVTQRVIFNVIQLRTTAGPLLLRNTRAWVFEEEKSKSVLVLSRPVMEHLGTPDYLNHHFLFYELYHTSVFSFYIQDSLFTMAA
ncbi:uncharacterized protein PITG_19705 [Phytophthora infestans T30-4]|uniref:Peptidase A2 domain-containing protein n=1 Tax=Phytophthora infestans (strain T30-4) TaxID=403677 RepID=D0P0X4_PHYIT|nr:uncharacterized protein PITG_19705 [Phytophthora infestans T30-4]EEY53682.1 conserved hypothetical protein [Phytophthora infestans T30-4]|eukprot:XP_002896036.1 conserved hypothetical protein [Phytophthora infestans T30-4]